MIGKLPRNGRIVSALGLSIQEHSQNVYGQNSIPCPALGPREAPVESAAEPSAVEFYTIASMLPTVLSEVNETKTSLYGFQYVVEICKGNENSSCLWQNELYQKFLRPTSYPHSRAVGRRLRDQDNEASRSSIRLHAREVFYL
jgi:hypothetical protein